MSLPDDPPHEGYLCSLRVRGEVFEYMLSVYRITEVLDREDVLSAFTRLVEIDKGNFCVCGECPRGEHFR